MNLAGVSIGSRRTPSTPRLRKMRGSVPHVSRVSPICSVLKLKPAALARWAEPLEQEILHTLRSQLLAAPSVGRVFVQPFAFDEPRDFDVSVRVIRCEGVQTAAGGRPSVRFAANVEVTRSGAAGDVVARRRFVAPEMAWDGKDYAQLAARISAAVAALSEDVIGVLPAKP